MDGIDKIISRISADARAECELINSETEKAVAELRANYKQQEQELYGVTLKAGAAEANALYERLVNVAQMETKKMILAEKQKILGETFLKAGEIMRSLPDAEYTGFLAKLAADASISGTEALIFSPEDNKRVGQKVTDAANNALRAQNRTANLTLSAETRNISGGLIVSGGAIEVNCALDRLIEQYRGELESAVAAVLFE